jgi:hypothetical protein
MARQASACHPDQPLAAKGLCARCYARERARRRGPAGCHPERPVAAKGLCIVCYQKSRPATCEHRQRTAYRGGKCRICAGLGWPKSTPRSPEANRIHTLAVYGLTVAEYDALLEAQGGGCAICGRPPGRKRLHVDHDHETDAIRGLLCSPCNRAIGLLRDDPEVARRAAEYLTPPERLQRIRLVG